MTAEMSGHEKAFVAGSKTPTQSAWYGVKTTRPPLVTAAPLNFESMLMTAAMSGHEKVPEDEVAWPPCSARR